MSSFSFSRTQSAVGSWQDEDTKDLKGLMQNRSNILGVWEISVKVVQKYSEMYSKCKQ